MLAALILAVPQQDKYCKNTREAQQSLNMVDRSSAVQSTTVSAPDLGTGQSLVAKSEGSQQRQQRLAEREQHHHKQLWTKDSHGGPYRKVRAGDCADKACNA